MILDCSFYPKCGGCQTLHMASTDYSDFKIQIVKNAFSHNNISPPIMPLIELGPGIRRRAVFKLKKGHIGFYQQKSHDLVPLNTCGVLIPELSALLKTLPSLHRWFNEADIEALWTQQGADIHIRTPHSHSFSLTQVEALTLWIEKEDWARLTINNQLFICRKSPTITLDKVSLSVSPGCFLQASVSMEKTLETLVEKWMIQQKQSPKILDLFCGRGTLSLPLSRYGSITGYESDEDAVLALNQGATKEKRPLKAHVRDLYKTPLNVRELEKYDLIVLNPPRAGAPAQIKAMASMSSKPILYVSCSPNSLAQDCAFLQKQGRHILSLQPIDAFFGSNHIEVVATIL